VRASPAGEPVAAGLHEAGAEGCRTDRVFRIARKDPSDFLATNPFQNPPPFEKLVGDLAGAYSRRINIQHRLVYEVIKERGIVKVLRMWTHFE
jgi:Txe/YoeB family toxin of toxin-antitoxin system